jgi:hypothetical protein
MQMERENLLPILPFIALAVALHGLVVARQFFGLMVFNDDSWAIPGSLFLFLAGFVTFVNIYTSFLRDRIHNWRHGNMDDFQFVSGVPAIGSVFVILGSLCFTQSPMVGTVLIALIIADTGGFFWFPLALFIDWYSGTKD